MMAEVQIAFKPTMARAALEGDKICTSRHSQKGQPGDVFRLADTRFKIVAVRRFSLYFVANALYREEGFNTPGEFIQEWAGIYPREGFQPTRKVWVHFFKRLI